jgi:hypothetical protein
MRLFCKYREINNKHKIFGRNILSINPAIVWLMLQADALDPLPAVPLNQRVLIEEFPCPISATY